jgi:purine nucleosidase
LVTLPATLKAHLRAADLPRLGAAGPLGQLLARQGRAHGLAHQMEKLGREHVGLPDDLVNFQYDPVACAVAVGWSGATTEEVRLRPALEGGVLSFQPDPMGRLTRVVVDVDSAAFDKLWMSAVESAGTRSVVPNAGT